MESFLTTATDAGQRLDLYLARVMSRYSRARLQEWIAAGRVRVDGAARRSSFKLRGGEKIEVEPAEPRPLQATAEEIPLEILYEDADVIVVNKRAGMVVHAGAGQHSGTLVNALLHRYGALSQAGGPLRPGIVHRLDKGTSGVLLVARTDEAHRHLAAQFAAREVEKTYLALVQGVVQAEQGVIDKPITRDPLRRTRMTARLAQGRTAHTEWRVRECFAKYTFLEVRIGTGRTHQIRVHLASIGAPVAGDTLYGAAALALGRPFLHAWRISFASPSSGTRVTIEAPLPGELELYKSGLL